MLVPVLYAGAMLFKSPTLSDALIVLALAAMSSFLIYLEKKPTSVTRNVKLVELEEQVQEERLKLSLDQLRENSLREKALRDARAAVEGLNNNQEIRF